MTQPPAVPVLAETDRPWLQRKWLLCADDFAYNTACSEAIAQLAGQGKIHATSVMVLPPGWAQDAPMLLPLRGRVSVGLHLDWTSHYAIQAGHGMVLGRTMLVAACRGIGTRAARAVIARQLDAFENHWGAAPDHIDGHQHVQQFAGIAQALVQEIDGRYPQQKPWLRISQPVPALPGLGRFKSWVIQAQGAQRLSALAKQANIPTRPWLSGIYDFQGSAARYQELLSQWTRSAPNGTVIMCHPALSAMPGDSIGAARVWEHSALASQQVQEELDTADGGGTIFP